MNLGSSPHAPPQAAARFHGTRRQHESGAAFSALAGRQQHGRGMRHGGAEHGGGAGHDGRTWRRQPSAVPRPWPAPAWATRPCRRPPGAASGAGAAACRRRAVPVSPAAPGITPGMRPGATAIHPAAAQSRPCRRSPACWPGSGGMACRMLCDGGPAAEQLLGSVRQWCGAAPPPSQFGGTRRRPIPPKRNTTDHGAGLPRQRLRLPRARTTGWNGR